MIQLIEGEFYWVRVRFRHEWSADPSWTDRVETMQFERGAWWVIGREYSYPKDEPSYTVLEHIPKPALPKPEIFEGER